MLAMTYTASMRMSCEHAKPAHLLHTYLPGCPQALLQPTLGMESRQRGADDCQFRLSLLFGPGTPLNVLAPRAKVRQGGLRELQGHGLQELGRPGAVQSSNAQIGAKGPCCRPGWVQDGLSSSTSCLWSCRVACCCLTCSGLDLNLLWLPVLSRHCSRCRCWPLSGSTPAPCRQHHLQPRAASKLAALHHGCLAHHNRQALHCSVHLLQPLKLEMTTQLKPASDIGLPLVS